MQASVWWRLRMAQLGLPDLKIWKVLKALAAVAILCLLILGSEQTSARQRTSPEVNESNPVESAPRPRMPGSGHRRMLELLRQIARRTQDEHIYLGSQRARELRSEIANLDDNAPDLTKWLLYLEAGKAELKLGNVRAGIDHLSRARQLVSEAQIKSLNHTRFHLGVAYMRLGETQNCSLHHTAESCIMPIQGGGLHTDREGSSKAIEYFLEVLKASAEGEYLHLAARWLLNIASMTLGRYPDAVPKPYLIPPQAFTSEIDFPRFKNVAPKLGLDTFNLSGGAIVDDFDNDEYLDIVTSTWDTSGQMHFFRNDQDGTFSDRTQQAGLLGLYGGLNLIPGDYDNDGDLDILVLRGAWVGKAGQHPNSLLRNDGQGRFEDVTFEAGLGEVHYPTQTAAWADYDNDGDLDLYVGNETSPEFTSPCQLFCNNGDGTFTDIAARAGVTQGGYAKGVAWGDYDGDRFPDLYVSNLLGPNRLYRNNRNGTFTNLASQLSVTQPLRSFPVWFWDFDNDGTLDLFVASYTGPAGHVAAYHLGLAADYELAGLYRGDGRGGFDQLARQQKLTYPIYPMGSNFGDLDNDGYLDFYLGTGDPEYANLIPNLMFLNRGGKGFVDVTMAGGFGHLQKGHSVAFADLDNDGDLDIFEQMGGAYPGDKFSDALYENPGLGNHWITIKLVGVQSNRSAIGARIRVEIMEGRKTRSVYRYVNSGGSFGANPLRQTIGLGKSTHIRQLEVFWPTTGRTQTFRHVPPDQMIQIIENKDEYTPLALKRLRF